MERSHAIFFKLASNEKMHKPDSITWNFKENFLGNKNRVVVELNVCLKKSAAVLDVRE